MWPLIASLLPIVGFDIRRLYSEMLLKKEPDIRKQTCVI